MWTWRQVPFPRWFKINGALCSKQGQFLVLKARRQIGIPPWPLLRDTDDTPNVLSCTLKIRTWPVYIPSFENSLQPHVITAWPLSWLTRSSNRYFRTNILSVTPSVLPATELPDPSVFPELAVSYQTSDSDPLLPQCVHCTRFHSLRSDATCVGNTFNPSYGTLAL